MHSESMYGAGEKRKEKENIKEDGGCGYKP
jgi:hypothetical protein